MTTVATTTNLTNLPAAPSDWLTAAAVKADAVTKIQAGLATPTNITAGTITTCTNLTNAAGAGDLTATMKTSVAQYTGYQQGAVWFTVRPELEPECCPHCQGRDFEGHGQRERQVRMVPVGL